MLDLWRFKEAIVSYMAFAFVKQMLNSRSVCNRIIPKTGYNWIMVFQSLVHNYNGVPGSKEAKINRVKLKVGNLPNHILGEDYATIERQAIHEDHTLDLCHTAAFSVWDRTEEVGKKIESFSKVIQDLKD